MKNPFSSIIAEEKKKKIMSFSPIVIEKIKKNQVNLEDETPSTKEERRKKEGKTGKTEAHRKR